MSIILEFAMFPTDKGSSVSEYVSRIIQMIKNRGVTYQLTSMGTIIETATIDQALDIVKCAYQTLEPDCDRIYSTLTFDIRKGGLNRLQHKVAAIEEKIGPVNK